MLYLYNYIFLCGMVVLCVYVLRTCVCVCVCVTQYGTGPGLSPSREPLRISRSQCLLASSVQRAFTSPAIQLGKAALRETTQLPTSQKSVTINNLEICFSTLWLEKLDQIIKYSLLHDVHQFILACHHLFDLPCNRRTIYIW